MLYILRNVKKQAYWMIMREDIYSAELKKHNIPFKILLEFNVELDYSDYLWVMHYEDLANVNVCNTKAKVIFEQSSTSCHPYCHMVDPSKEEDAFLNVIDYNLVFSPKMARYMLAEFPNCNFIPMGSPVYIDTSIYKDVLRIPKKIVVGGRLSPEKQFYLAAFLLYDLVQKYDYEVVFCYPDVGDAVDWNTFYRCSNFESKGFKFKSLHREAWLSELASAEIFFTASLGDVVSSTAVEAALLGVYTVVPEMEDGELPLYSDYVSNGYDPFCRKSVTQMILNKPRQLIFDTWFNSDKWGNRFVKALQNNFN